jgi:hypothetical protein
MGQICYQHRSGCGHRLHRTVSTSHIGPAFYPLCLWIGSQSLLSVEVGTVNPPWQQILEPIAGSSRVECYILRLPRMQLPYRLGQSAVLRMAS